MGREILVAPRHWLGEYDGESPEQSKINIDTPSGFELQYRSFLEIPMQYV